MILPMVKYLESYGVQFHYGVKVTNVAFDCANGKKQATRIDTLRDGHEECIDLTENDLVFITNGGCVENSTIGSQTTVAPLKFDLKVGGGGIRGARSPPRTPASATLGRSSAMTRS